MSISDWSSDVCSSDLVDTVEEAIMVANDCEFGLQASCFTRDLETAFRVGREVRAGSGWINEASRFRLDNYPFGGFGNSGSGREGIRYTMEEYTPWKFLGIRPEEHTSQLQSLMRISHAAFIL